MVCGCCSRWEKHGSKPTDEYLEQQQQPHICTFNKYNSLIILELRVHSHADNKLL